MDKGERGVPRPHMGTNWQEVRKFVHYYYTLFYFLCHVILHAIYHHNSHTKVTKHCGQGPAQIRCQRMQPADHAVNMRRCFAIDRLSNLSCMDAQQSYGNFVPVGLPASRGILSLFLMRWLSWCIVCIITTTLLMPLQHCIGCVSQNGSISRWLSWRFTCCMAMLQHTWVSWFVSLTHLVVANSDHCRHNYPTFHLSVGLLWDGAHFLLQHPFSKTPCHWTFSDRPLYPFSVNGSRHFFSVNLSPTFHCDIFGFIVHTLMDFVRVLLFEPG